MNGIYTKDDKTEDIMDNHIEKGEVAVKLINKGGLPLLKSVLYTELSYNKNASKLDEGFEFWEKIILQITKDIPDFTYNLGDVVKFNDYPMDADPKSKKLHPLNKYTDCSLTGTIVARTDSEEDGVWYQIEYFDSCDNQLLEVNQVDIISKRINQEEWT